MTDCLKLTVYFGEHDRREGRLASDLLLDLFQRHGIRAAALVRAVEGFGIKHQLHTQRLLTLSEDLPLVTTAVGAPALVQAMLPKAARLISGGLLTLERARLVTAPEHWAGPLGDGASDSKLTLFLGRRERLDGKPAYVAAVEALRRHGAAGATVVLGVDGIVHGARTRARFLSTNADVPLLVVSVGTAASLERALAELCARLDDPLATIERVRVLKRDGRTLAELDPDPDEPGFWRKLTIYAGEQARHGKHPLYVALIHLLRLEGASGATAVRGIWGYSGRHEPHGDRMLALRRRVPVVVTLVDRPQAARRWWRLIDGLTAQAGLVTSELVPTAQAVGPSSTVGAFGLLGGAEAGDTGSRPC